VAIGLTRTGEVVFANLEFMDGTRGAHVSISGISGVATKTSYATFLLYSLFHSQALARTRRTQKQWCSMLKAKTCYGSTGRTAG